jgi:glyoxylase I family protein
MLKINKVHHIAIIASDYQKSKYFYTEILGLQIVREVYREARNSYKLDLAIRENYIIELFSFPNPPARPSRPESCGLRHLAFEVEDVAEAKQILEAKGIEVEDIRIDEFTGKKFTFFADPDDLPIEFYEQSI